MSVAFVFTNPRHHLDMMSPVAVALERRGVPCRLVSLAEFRGFDTPRDDARLVRAIPVNVRGLLRRGRRGAAGGAAGGAATGGDGPVEPAAEPLRTRLRRVEVLRRAVWEVLKLRLRPLLRGARVVVVPNDMVYPYRQLVDDVHARGARTVLMQEGIRFPMPAGYAGPVYGGSGAAAICAWGEGSREYFVGSGAPAAAIAVTGSPRLDTLDVAAWRERGRALLAERRLAAAPIAFLSNPIEMQDLATKQEKLALFGQFLAGAAPIARARGIPIVVKTHAHEDPADYARVAAASPIPDLVTALGAEPIFAVLGAARAGVVLTSTVGLEALVFGVPLAQLEIPRHPFAFEYVPRGAATPLRQGAIGAGLEELLAEPWPRREAAAAFVARHLHEIGRATARAADAIERVLRQGAAGAGAAGAA